MDIAKNNFLGKERLGRLMLKFSVPCVLSLLISALYNIVDQIFVGHSPDLSVLGNAATGVVFPIFIISQAFAWCFGDGVAAFVNISQGRGDTKSVAKAIGGGTIATLLSSLVLMAVFYPVKVPLLTLFGASENTLGLAVEYFDIILAFFPVYMLMNYMNSVIRADGSPDWAMASTLTGAIINIALDPTFLYGFRMGMAGAAWATVIGQCASFAIAVAYIAFRAKTFRLKIKDFIPDKVLVPVVKLGASTFITQVTIVVISVVCNAQLARYGLQSDFGVDIPIAIIAIESKVFTIVLQLVVGVALGCQPIISYNLSAKNYGRVKALYKYIAIFTLAVGVVATVIIEGAPDAVVGIFGSPANVPEGWDPEVFKERYWEFGRLTFRIFMMLVTFSCMVKASSIFFQAACKPAYAAVAAIVRDIVFFVPLACLMPLSSLGIIGILVASPMADAAAMALVAALVIIFFRSLKRREREEAETEVGAVAETAEEAE